MFERRPYSEYQTSGYGLITAFVDDNPLVEANRRPLNQHVATVDDDDLSRAKALLHQIKIRLGNIAASPTLRTGIFSAI